ncbi:MAG TPA: ABC transporter ATP-binding protein [Actinomycetota bacterium]|jgi:ABC-2 type transport system ATP-binding protein|nr:ABC transporter ATP-binding protein [Actinomycetota bacterium]
MAAGAIEIQDLVKRYGRKTAVDEVSLSVREGETFGYLGPNGAGKTTTLRCVLGLIAPTAGTISVMGHDVRKELKAVLSLVGYLPGEFTLWPQLTGEECLEYLGSLHPRPPVRRGELCDRFELSKADLKRQVRLYSRGMKQKVGIIQAFQHRPPLAIMDEPTEGLDPLMKERFVALLAEHRSGGGTTFLSSHILSEVEETADRVGVIRAGRLVRVGAADDLTGERVRHCTVVLKEPLSDPTRLSLPGVSAFDGDGTRFRFEYRGDMQPLIQALATLPVQEFLAEPESLAEAFFEVYGGGR